MSLCHDYYHIINDYYNVLNNYYYILYYSAIFLKRDILDKYIIIISNMTQCHYHYTSQIIL